MSQIVSVNVGAPRTVEWFGRQVRTAIWKSPVPGSVALRGVNFDGDDQADRRVHGGPDKAVYAYAHEDYSWWSDELGSVVASGTFGENLTTDGLDLMACVVGERWQVGSAELEVSQPRMPCFKLGIRMGDAAFVDRFDDAMRNGAYLRIVREGSVKSGDDVTIVDRPSHGLCVRDIVVAYHTRDDTLVQRMLDVPAVPRSWQVWAERAMESRT
jgi:MOSC domain-containing protein YiiM